MMRELQSLGCKIIEISSFTKSHIFRIINCRDIFKLFDTNETMICFYNFGKKKRFSTIRYIYINENVISHLRKCAFVSNNLTVQYLQHDIINSYKIFDECLCTS